MESEFQKTLYGLTSKALDDQNDPHEFSFTPFAIKDRFWKTSWNTKWFLAPIPQTEINKEYGMTQILVGNYNMKITNLYMKSYIY